MYTPWSRRGNPRKPSALPSSKFMPSMTSAYVGTVVVVDVDVDVTVVVVVGAMVGVVVAGARVVVRAPATVVPAATVVGGAVVVVDVVVGDVVGVETLGTDVDGTVAMICSNSFSSRSWARAYSMPVPHSW